MHLRHQATHKPGMTTFACEVSSHPQTGPCQPLHLRHRAERLGPPWQGCPECPRAVSEPQRPAPPLRLPDARSGYRESRRCLPNHAAEAGQRLSLRRGSFGSRRPHSPASSRAAARRNQFSRLRGVRVAPRAEPAPGSPLVHLRGLWGAAPSVNQSYPLAQPLTVHWFGGSL